MSAPGAREQRGQSRAHGPIRGPAPAGSGEACRRLAMARGGSVPVGIPGAGTLPEEAFGAVLAGLPGMTPRLLRMLLSSASPRAAWDRLGSGRVPRQHARLVEAVRRTDVDRCWQAVVSAGASVKLLGAEGYPSCLGSDPEAPAVLFSTSEDIGWICARPRVAVVGTRSATHYGRSVAFELGGELAARGVVVISGLARGVDCAAHDGAVGRCVDEPSRGPSGAGCGAPPLGVAGGGVDVVYPASSAQVWSSVVQLGAVISEAPPGAPPNPWRFPQRNRIIAAMSHVVVVVESHEVGGALRTVECAMQRGVSVMAVPGSVRSPASAGANALLSEGCAPVRDVSDILVALDLAGAGRAISCSQARGQPDSLYQQISASRATPAAEGGGHHERSPEGGHGGPGGDVSGLDASVLSCLGWEPLALDAVVESCGAKVGSVAAALDRLERRGLVRGIGGWWQRDGRR